MVVSEGRGPQDMWRDQGAGVEGKQGGGDQL